MTTFARPDPDALRARRRRIAFYPGHRSRFDSIHSLNLETLKSTQGFTFGSGLVGLVTLSSLAWVTAYATIRLYNLLASR